VEDAKQSEDWKTLLAVRTEVLKALEEARQSKLIGGANLEAQVILRGRRARLLGADTLQGPVALPIHRFGSHARASRFSNGTGGVSVRVSKAEGENAGAAGITPPMWATTRDTRRYANAAVPC